MVENQDPEGPERARPFRPRLLPMLAAVVVVVGLALFPDQDSSPNLDSSPNMDSVAMAPASLVDPGLSREGFIGLPPEGARPSTPESGELVLRSFAPGPRHGWVYADGRVIRWWHHSLPEGANDRVTGLLEQRLTPEGVELLLAAIPSTAQLADVPGDFLNPFDGVLVRDHDGVLRSVTPTGSQLSAHTAFRELVRQIADPESWLPARAWEDPEVRGYVPSRFEVCYEPSVLTVLPAHIQDILLARDVPSDPDFFEYCTDMTTENARVFAGALDDWLAQGGAVGGPGRSSWRRLSYQIDASSLNQPESIWFEPYLPHGEVLCSHCGW